MEARKMKGKKPNPHKPQIENQRDPEYRRAPAQEGKGPGFLGKTKIKDSREEDQQEDHQLGPVP